MNIIKSMDSCVKSREQYENKLSEEVTCMLGVKQGECLSPFHFRCFWTVWKILLFWVSRA